MANETNDGFAQRQPNGAVSRGPSSAHRDAAVRTFMQKFAAALSGGDAKAIALMWGVPALVMHDGGTRAVSTRQEVEAFFSGAKEQYAARGINEARPEIQSLDWLTERIVITKVRWPYIDTSGREIGEESSTYTLRQDDDGKLNIIAIVMHGETKPQQG